MLHSASVLPPFIRTRLTAQVLGYLFLFTAAVSWIAVGYDVAEVRLVSAAKATGRIEPAEYLAHAITGRCVSALQLFCILATGLLFMIWLHRVRVNVRAMGVRRLEYRREWTVIGFLIPVLNALRPYQVVSEIWRASDPRTGDPMTWKTMHVPSFVSWWWCAFVAYIVLEILTSIMLDTSPGVRRVGIARSIGTIADICAAVSASLAYFVVVEISAAQDQKRAAWGQGVPLDPDVPIDPRDVMV